MYNEFYRHKKSDAAKWIIVFLLIILLAGYLAAVGFAALKELDSFLENALPGRREGKG